MIVSVATSLQSVEELRAAMAADPAFIHAVFTSDEIAYCEGKRYPEVHFAARWAAKKATFQALGLPSERWLEITTRNSGNGCPTLHWEGATKRAADRLGVERVLLSLTHTRDLAAAFVVLDN